MTLGCDSVADYERSGAYFGAIIGRCANRIARGRMNVNGQSLELACNNGSNHLHGGCEGFDRKIWRVEQKRSDAECSLILQYTSVDGEEGYPGNLAVRVGYTLNDRNELRIDYQASTDQPTVVNLTNHTYFNLRGKGDCLGHRLQLHGDRYTPADEMSIPTGAVESVEGTPMDFRVMKGIGEEIHQDFIQLCQSGGYDHNWVLRTGNERPSSPQLLARAEEPESGRTLEVLSTQSGVQFYTGNFLEGEPGRGGKPCIRRAGFCLETQHFPDAPNQREFPSIELSPGEEYRHQTVFRFGLMS